MNNELTHYGVLGMKWGVRRYQPYPTSGGPKGRYVGDKPKKKIKKEPTMAKRQTAAQAQALATTLADLGRKMGAAKLIELGKNDPRVRAGVFAANQAINVLDSGAAIAAVEKLQGKNEWAIDKKLASAKTVDQITKNVVPGINPGYGVELGTINNCRRATMAYELRRRGYDVEARKTAFGTGATRLSMARAITPGSKVINHAAIEELERARQSMVSKLTGGRRETPLYDYAKSQGKENLLSNMKTGERLGSMLGITAQKNMEKSTKAIFDGLSKQPNGSRGDLTVWWLTGGGHSIAYEIINNKPVIFDTQSSKVYKNANDLVNAGYLVGRASFTRLDNVELNKDFVERWVKNARS